MKDVMTYTTIERTEAAYLLSQNYPLLSAEIKPGSKLVQFAFHQDSELKTLLLNFENNKELQRFIQGLEQVAKLIRRAQDARSVAERLGNR